MIDLLINWITSAWQAIFANIGWMSWNLFLALIPLALSVWLFCPSVISKPSKMRLRGAHWRSQSPILIWCIGLLLGLSFLPNAYRVGRQFHRLIQTLDSRYLLIALVITVTLMGVDIWQRRQQHQSHRLSVRWWLGVLVFILFLPNAPYVLTDVIHLIDQIRQGYSVWIISLALIPQYLVFMFIGFEAYVLSLIYLDRYLLDQQGWKQNRWIAELTIHALCAVGIYLGRFYRFNSWDIITNPDVLMRSMVDNLLNHRPLLVMSVTFVVLSVLYGLMKLITLAVLPPSSSPEPM